jgi:hypothetical protein
VSTKRSHKLMPYMGHAAPVNMAVQTKIGHNGTHVLIVHSVKIDNYTMTEAEAELHITAVQNALAALREARGING